MVSDTVSRRDVLAVFGTIAGFTLGIAFGTLMVLHYGRQSYHFSEVELKSSKAPAQQSHHFAQSMSKANDDAAHIEHEDANCIKFIMFTTQRSGSGWLCEALGHQPEVWCPMPGELMATFKRLPESKNSKKWMKEVDRKFDTVCQEARKQGKRIAGFKIMYNQVGGEHHTVNGVDLPREWFKDYLQKRKVRILHLVREAVILTVASKKQTSKFGQETHLAVAHTRDPDVAAAMMNSTKIIFGQPHLERLRDQEHEILTWLAFLRHLGLPYHFVRYEDLTSPKQAVFVHMMLEFLGIKDQVSYPKFQSEFYLSHKARCEDRIDHWEERVKRLIQGTMSERACAVLQYSALV
eukprot:Skav225915  [mRNA]  locus=scaffold1500:150542:151591:- [translate_table: standard]